jgi:site-specific recombinase XerC
MLEIIRASSEFVMLNQRLPSMPFILDVNGFPFNLANQYLLHRALDRRLNIEKTVLVGARQLCIFMNELGRSGVDIESVNDSAIILARNSLQKNRAIKNSGVNGYLSEFYQFMWWLQKTDRCQSLIGIPDRIKKQGPFQISVDPPRMKGREYRIPLLLKDLKRKSRRKDSIENWDKAYNETFEMRDQALGMRDLLMLRLIREVYLRRFEVVWLRVSLFESVPSAESKVMYVTLEVDKNGKGRTVKVSVDLYREIQIYTKTVRKRFLRNAVSDRLFLSSKTGKGLTEGAVNDILGKYAVHPHDGRAIGLTERFCELIGLGIDQKSAILLVSQEAGHSQSGDGKTLLDHYLMAQEIVAGDDQFTLSSIRNENLKLSRENKQLLKRLNEMEATSRYLPS